ncbi:hypothetical protein COO91_06887 [Nostoc flagelliforme CCNUN1]|uniref:Uncharacterized protein n=1 Tax=Nostoc flagelliforme CCNUN1 TaxID=2038116 RepID=A0A2K8SZS5_9NOSO|nr:hypothetical protein COO91_06887 [Nostoc flagelliforme CCNUN1]
MGIGHGALVIGEQLLPIPYYQVQNQQFVRLLGKCVLRVLGFATKIF